MRFWIIGIIILATLPGLSACLSLGNGTSPAMPQAGMDDYFLEESTAQSASGCRFEYRVFIPATPETTTSVILGHGFLRDQDNMVGIGRALANAGIRVVTLDFCNMRPWNGHHERNAQDMRALAKTLGLQADVIYAGFSAGALAAILASDQKTRAIMTLDLVDQNDLGLQAIADLDVPLIGLAGPDSGCNANGNGETVFRARAAILHTELTQIPKASHCEFETPSNWLCEVACGDKDDAQTDRLETDAIVQMVVSKIRPFLSRPDEQSSFPPTRSMAP